MSNYTKNGSACRNEDGGGIPLLPVCRFAAAIFDLDGVITRTARLHAAAWKRVFDDLLRSRNDWPDTARRPFDAEDYRRHVDGLPRLDGIASFLASRGIGLPMGDVADPPGSATVHGIGNAKNAAFNALLDSEGAEPCEGARDLLTALRNAGLRLGLVSSSRNAARVLRATGLADLFDLVIDGARAAALGVRGKPAPDTFLAAADALGTAPGHAIVVEDAISGVSAAKAGGFGLIIGIDRSGSPQALSRAGADIVVSELSAVRLPGQVEQRR